MEANSSKDNFVKIHRRLSSVFVPPQAPILDRTATIVSKAVTPLSIRFRLRPAPLSNEREVFSNCLADPSVCRYELYNYRKYCGNRVVTTKYNIITFIPKNIYEQFHRIANAYFVMIAGLNWIPALQAFNRYLGMIPVALILILTAIKDAYEDFRRHRLDNKVNSTYCHVWDRDKNRFRKMQWQHLIVGDFVHLSLDEVIPADILLVRSSDPQGICFVETSNLDGETSLKQRRVPSSLITFSGDESGFKPPDFKASIICEEPNSVINQMKGRIMFQDGDVEALCHDNMLLRGCQLRNTTFVEGLVLYAGNDTKAMMNNSGPRYKRSSLELATNRFILYCVAILVGMCVFGGVASMLWLFSFSPHTDTIIYIILNSSSPITEGAINLVSSILNYQILIPLSLYISVELVKLGQIYFISVDCDLYYEKKDKAMECRSLNIPEELGQIQYVMSDKTGTLTENLMIFRRCSIGGVDYGADIKFSSLPKDLRVDNVITSAVLKKKLESEWSTKPELLDFFITMAICNTVVVNNVPRQDTIELGFVEDGVFTTGNSTFLYSLDDPDYPCCSRTRRFEFIEEEKSTDELETDLNQESENEILNNKGGAVNCEKAALPPLSRSSTLSQRLHGFFRNRLLSGQKKKGLCDEEKKGPPTPLYEAESPDELALVYAARAYGVSLVTRNSDSMIVTFPYGNEQSFEILRVLPFDSARKRMSIIIRKEDEIILYCKGADSEMIESLSRQFVNSTSGGEILRRSKEQLQRYSTQGLRTLCLARRSLSLLEYESWAQRHAEIENDISNQLREKLLANSIDSIEKEMILLGVTAIEDRLQEGVEWTIASLREAGIQVWLLTGDKMETAINIARSCGLFPPSSSVCVIDTESDMQTAYARVSGASEVDTFCIVLSSASLRLLEKEDNLLIPIIKRSLSVLCYRMTPSNKAEVVRLGKKTLKGKVLAIGDGANDVPMIQRADVGIGISGQEGMQAVMASDFAIARFRFLHKLLLVHGHWCYDRLARTFLYFLYKNALFVFVIFWCQLYNGFSGAAPMDQIYMMTYPIVFTGAQPLVFGIYEQIAHRDVLSDNPKLYTVGRKGKLYRGFHFWLNIADAVWQSVVIYFIALLTYWDTDTDHHSFGFLLASSIFLVNMTHLAVEVHCWTTPMATIFVFFILVHFLYFWVEDKLASPYWNLKDPPADVAMHAERSVEFWAALLLSIAVSVFPRCFAHVFLNCLWPSAVFRESLRRQKNCDSRGRVCCYL